MSEQKVEGPSASATTSPERLRLARAIVESRRAHEHYQSARREKLLAVLAAHEAGMSQMQLARMLKVRHQSVQGMLLRARALETERLASESSTR